MYINLFINTCNHKCNNIDIYYSNLAQLKSRGILIVTCVITITYAVTTWIRFPFFLFLFSFLREKKNILRANFDPRTPTSKIKLKENHFVCMPDSSRDVE